jgi:putative oxidoreductase
MIDYLNYGLNVAQHGFGHEWLGRYLLQVMTGLFFACSGVNKLFNKGRHATIVETLTADKVPFVKFNQWWVPGNEFVGGLMLMLNILPVFFACVLSILLCVACKAEAWKRVRGYSPINRVDTVDDFLYLPEIIYLLILVSIIIG